MGMHLSSTHTCAGSGLAQSLRGDSGVVKKSAAAFVSRPREELRQCDIMYSGTPLGLLPPSLLVETQTLLVSSFNSLGMMAKMQG